MGHGLIGEKIWRTAQPPESLQAKRPIQFSKQENEAGVGWVQFLCRIEKETFIAGKAIIGQIKCRNRRAFGQICELTRSREKKNIRIGVKSRAICWKRH